MLLNCDIGESYGAWTMGLDDQVMPYIDQANIACGFHAGDPLVMYNTVGLALQHKVTLGAPRLTPISRALGGAQWFAARTKFTPWCFIRWVR